MYYAFFGLKQPPFRITPDTDFFFGGGNRGAVLEALIYAVSRGEGIVKVTGEVGSGKTMLCRMLQQRLPHSVETVYLANPSVSADEILHAIAFELQLPTPPGASRLVVMHALNEYLLAKHAEGKQVVVFVEESQSMPLATLEEIRLLSNLETRQNKLLQIVLFGQPELDANLRKVEIRQLRERITHSFSLSPLTALEVRDYLVFRLRAAGYRGPDLFAPRVIRYLAAATGGLTRRINIVADKTLLAAFSDNTHNVMLKHVQAAVRDSEFSKQWIARAWLSRLDAVSLVGLAALALLTGVLVQSLVQWYETMVSTPPVRPFSVPSNPKQPLLQSKPPQTRPAQVNSPSATTQPAAAVRALRSADATHASSTSSRNGSETAASQDNVVSDLPLLDPDLLAQRLLATERWLAEEQDEVFSIQLLGSSDPALLRSYLKTLSNYIHPDRIFVYRTVANREPSMTVLYGAFPGRTAALESLDRLPAQLKANHPYIRTLQGIRDELALNKPS